MLCQIIFKKGMWKLVHRFNCGSILACASNPTEAIEEKMGGPGVLFPLNKTTIRQLISTTCIVRAATLKGRHSDDGGFCLVSSAP